MCAAAALRKGLSLFSEKLDLYLEPGDLVECFDCEVLTMSETTVRRVRCSVGWASVSSMTGNTLLRPAEGSVPNRFTSDSPGSPEDGSDPFEDQDDTSCCMALVKVILVFAGLLVVLNACGVVESKQSAVDWGMWAWYRYKGSGTGGGANGSGAASLDSGSPPARLPVALEDVDPLFSPSVWYPGIGRLSIISNLTDSSAPST